MTNQKRSDLYLKLKNEVFFVSWPEITPYYREENFLLLADEHDLIDVGVMMALDETGPIKKLITSDELKNISDKELNNYKKSTKDKFYFIIIQPYVIIQRETKENQYPINTDGDADVLPFNN